MEAAKDKSVFLDLLDSEMRMGVAEWAGYAAYIKIPLNPVAASRPQVPRFGKPYYVGRYKEFKEVLMPDWILRNQRPVEELLTGDLFVRLDFYVAPPKKSKLRFPKPDIDNYEKAIYDAMTGWLWKDDCQVAEHHVRKLWDKPGGAGYVELLVKVL